MDYSTKVDQLHSLPEAGLAKEINTRLQSEKQDKASASALVSGLSGTLYAKNNPIPLKHSSVNQNQLTETPATKNCCTIQ